MALESDFQGELLNDIRSVLKDCIIMKNDANYLQGVPDILILHNDQWATLECKKHAKAKTQPNQPWYVETMNRMSFSAFIFPENREQVLSDLFEHFGA